MIVGDLQIIIDVRTGRIIYARPGALKDPPIDRRWDPIAGKWVATR